MHVVAGEVVVVAIVCHVVVVIVVVFPAVAHHPMVLCGAGHLPDLQRDAQVAVTVVAGIDRRHDRTDRIGVITSAIDKTTGKMLPEIDRMTGRMLPEISTMIAKTGMMIAAAVSPPQS